MNHKLIIITFCLLGGACLSGSLEAQELKTVQPDSASRVKWLEDLVITGQYKPQSLKQSVYNVRVISQEQIKMRGATDVTGLLNNELGLRFSQDYALGETDTRIMGLGGQRVKVLMDGIPLTDRDGTKQSLTQIDINTIERIEIVEGPMSVIYGTDALAGVINIITKETPGGLNITARLQEETIGDSYHPFTDEGIHNQHLGISWQQKNWRFSAYGTRNNMGGYADTVAYPAKLSKPKDQWVTGGTIGFRNSKVNTWYRLDYLQEDLFAAGIMSVNTYKGYDQHFITNRFTHQAQADWHLSSKLRINSAASYQDYKRNTESYQVDYRTGASTPATVDGSWDVSKFSTVFFRTTAQWSLSDKISVQPGIEIKSDQTSGQRISGNPSIQDYAVFTSAEITPVTGITIRPGLRLSKNSVYDAPPVIPSINTKLVLSPQADIRLSYARGFRAPILRELYFNFKDANHEIEGNPDLKAEYSNSFTGSVSWENSKKQTTRYNIVISGFYNKFFDFIGMALKDNTSISSYFNLAQYKTAGGTIQQTLTYKNLRATVGFAWIGQYNAYSEGDKSLPAFNWSPELNSNITYAFPAIKARAGLFYKFTGSMPRYAMNDGNELYLARQSAWHLADLTASKQLFRYITLQAGIKNLFDVQKIKNGLQTGGGAHSSGNTVLAGFGRSYFAGIQFQLHP